MTRIIRTLGATFIVSAALIAPVFAQYAPGAPVPGYYGPAYGYGPIYGPTVLPRVYYRAPPVFPFYGGGGWVPEPIFDVSRVGGIDPTIRPSN
jgi:hypothetical protein